MNMPDRSNLYFVGVKRPMPPYVTEEVYAQNTDNCNCTLEIYLNSVNCDKRRSIRMNHL